MMNKVITREYTKKEPVFSNMHFVKRMDEHLAIMKHPGEELANSNPNIYTW